MLSIGSLIVTVFSAHAEVVPRMLAVLKRTRSILRARGGSSTIILTRITAMKYSPRTRR